MAPPIYPALLLAAALITLYAYSRVAEALQASEYGTHAAILQRSAISADSRREPRYRLHRQGTAEVLGDILPKVPCHIVNASRSGLRIASRRPFPQGAQVYVQWGDRFFVGTVCHITRQGEETHCGLELLSCNYTRPPRSLLRFWS